MQQAKRDTAARDQRWPFSDNEAFAPGKSAVAVGQRYVSSTWLRIASMAWSRATALGPSWCARRFPVHHLQRFDRPLPSRVSSRRRDAPLDSLNERTW